MNTLKIWKPVTLASLGLLLVSGCSDGPELGLVSGTVKLQGQAVPHALVMFQPVDPPGTYGAAYTKADGTYELRFSDTRNGATLGKHQVKIRTASQDEIQVEDKHTGLMVTPELPKGYQGRLEFEFDRTVASGSNAHDFDLDPTKVPKPAKTSGTRRVRRAAFLP